MRLACVLLLLLSICQGTLHAQASDSITTLHRGRKLAVAGGSGLLCAGSLLGLNQAWYKPYNTGRFHTFDDNAEWLQMDKAGHLYTSYQTSRLMMEAFEWAGFNKKLSTWVGGTVGFFYLTGIEIMDGYSRGWGYSWGDQLSDATGCLLAIGQQNKWGRQKLLLKFSFGKSGLAPFNPELLGKSLPSQILKDYNGQTYWLSLSPASFLDIPKFPRWLCFSLGYGAYGMLNGHQTSRLAQDEYGNVFVLQRERRLYLSIDIDFSRLPIKNKFMKTLASVINLVKFPAPALQLSKSGTRVRGFFF